MMGLGYIGLPTAALIAGSGNRVHGVDVNPAVVDTINKGQIHIVEPSLDKIVSKAVKAGLLKASLTPVEADVYLIVVPTPFKGKNEPDISFVEAATKAVIPLLKKGDLYIVESTSPIGTTEKMKQLIYDQRPELNSQLYIAYCPERVLPGNVMYELFITIGLLGTLTMHLQKKQLFFTRNMSKEPCTEPMQEQQKCANW